MPDETLKKMTAAEFRAFQAEQMRQQAAIQQETTRKAAKQARNAKIESGIKNVGNAGKKVADAGWNATKKAASAGGSLMGGVFGGAGKKLDDFDTRIHGEASHPSRFLFWFAVLVQLVDVFFLKYDRTAMLPFAIAMYSLLVIFAVFAFRTSKNLHGVGQIAIFVLFSAIYIILPFFFGLIPSIQFGNLSLINWVSLIIAAVPIWPIYIGMKEQIPFVRIYLNLWLVFLLVVFLFGFVINIRAGSIVALGGSPEMLQAGAAADFLWQKAGESWASIRKTFNFKVVVPRLMNFTGLNYYTGMVDQNEKQPVGLYINNVRLADKYAYVGYPVTIWADIRGKSFTEQIEVDPSCYIDKVAEGETEPDHLSILGEEHDTLSCTFRDLSKGTYTAKVGATFNFETWAYVTYTFMDIETKRSMEIQGKNVNSELDIPRLPQAVYSNGPAFLGMGSMVDQPVGIDIQNNNRDPVLGVTLDNQWTDGKIAKVKEFIIQVPSEFALKNCDRWPAGEDQTYYDSADGYDFYRFTNIGDVRQQFQSVTCRIHIKDPVKFLAGTQKIQRTFVARASYIYLLEKPVSIYVRE